MPLRRQFLIAVAVAVFTPAAYPQEFADGVHVSFDERRTPRSFDNSIAGFEEVVYVVPLRQGQSLRVALSSSNISSCFDIYAPGETKPVFVGGDSGSTHRLLARTSGDYRVKVYLLRLAARDDQSARYTLEFELSD
jgi:hypothetical protein